MTGRPVFFIAGFYVAVGATTYAFGLNTLGKAFAFAGAFTLIVACVLQVISNRSEGKTNGRHRKAPEAHRAGAGGGAGDRARTFARGGSLGAGAGMNPLSNPNYFARDAEELENRQRAALGLPPKNARPPKPKARPAGDFDGTNAEFAAGVVTGTRSFSVDKLGRLTGVSYPVVWTPGENVAKCMEQADFATALGGGYYSARGGYVVMSDTRVMESQRPPHSLAGCQHGFYGYYEGSNDYYSEGRIMGVVEAYGDTVIGTRGFRASKARIVALHLPAELAMSARKLVARNYADIPLFDSFDAMVAEFPPDDGGHGINPTTDPDFWTRRA